MQALAQLRRNLVQLSAFINFNRLTGRVQHHAAVLAPRGMNAYLLTKIFAQFVVEVIRKLAQQVGAVHAVWPSFFCPKYLLRRSRNWSLARNNLDFTAGTLKPSASAVSSVERFSMSRSVKTVRNPGGSPWMVLRRISPSSFWS